MHRKWAGAWTAAARTARRRCPLRRRSRGSCHGIVIKGAPAGALFAGPVFFVAAGAAKPHKPRMNAPATFETLPRFASALKAIESLKPTEPLYLVHPEKFAAAAKQL